MITTRRRLLSGLLALLMVASLFAAIPFTAGATEKTIAEGVIYKLGDTIVLPGNGIYYVKDSERHPAQEVYSNGTITEFEGDEYSYSLMIDEWGIYARLDTFDYQEELNQGLSVLGITFTGSGTETDPYLPKLALGVFESTWAGEGEGTEDSPWLINDVEDLRTLSANVKSGMKYTGKYLKLMADIDCGSGNWEPIGQGATFGGTFDGNGNTIIYHITNSTVEANGLFSEIAATGTVKNLSVSGSIFSSGNFNGGIAGKNGGLIINCLSTVDITTSKTHSGGIAGSNWLEASKTRYCVSTGTFTWTGASNSYAYIGGITGENRWGAIDHCAMLGDVLAQNTTESWAYAGILIGREMGSTTDCYYLNTAETAGAVNSDSVTAKTADELKEIGQAAYDAGYTVYGLALGATNLYTITWKNDDGSVIDTTSVAYGTVPTHADPTKDADAQYTYTFAGWNDGTTTYAPDADLPEVTGEATYTATFSTTVNEYTITWKNDDGSVIDTTSVAYGEVPTHADPTKDADAQYTYTFAGWDTAPVAVTGDATYTATFTANVNEYTITWKNDDGSVIDTTSVAYGTVPTHADPTKDADAQYTYTFAGWDTAPVAVIGDATYTATFTANVNEYTITWKNDDGSVIDTTTVAYGIVPTHDDPIKEDDEEFTYTFAGWDTEPVSVTGEATYTATFNAEPKIREGVCVDPDGEIRFYVDGEPTYAGLVEFNGDFYYINSTKKAVKNCTYGITEAKANGLLPSGLYTFDEDGKLVLSTIIQPADVTIMTEDDLLAINQTGITGIFSGEPATVCAGAFFEANDTHNHTARFGTGRWTVDYDLSFDAPVDGSKVSVFGNYGDYGWLGDKLSAGGIDSLEAGESFKIMGEWFATAFNGIFGTEPLTYDEVIDIKDFACAIAVEGYEDITATLKLVITDPEGVEHVVGTQEFVISEADPVEPIVPKNGLCFDEDGEIRFYVDDVPTYAGLVEFEGDYYYINSAKKAIKDATYVVTKTNGLKDAGTYAFGADGKMVVPAEPEVKNGLCFDEDGEIRFYVDGKPTYAGLVEYEGDFYYINSAKKAVKNCSYGITTAKANGLVPTGLYNFGADGKMIID